MKKDLRNLTLLELTDAVEKLGLPAYRAKQVYDWLYKSKVNSIGEMNNLPKDMKLALDAEFTAALPEITQEARSEIDNTAKYLFELRDGAKIESVLMCDHERVTLCASTQAGCACGCRFCATGSLGFTRDLETAEILGQFIAVERQSGVKITNVVFMGMGEPLLNWENLKKALLIISDSKGMNFSQTRITISTVGITNVIREIAAGKYKFNLAVSLITADDSKRSELMPMNKKYTLSDILSACKYYNKETEREITFEYILFSGVNDSIEDAEKLLRTLKGIDYKINLIPYNSVEGKEFTKPERQRVQTFQDVIMKAGKKAFIRREKGADIAAACGQLAGRAVREEEDRE